MIHILQSFMHTICILSFFLSIHTATPSLEDYEQVYIVHTGFELNTSLGLEIITVWGPRAISMDLRSERSLKSKMLST